MKDKENTIKLTFTLGLVIGLIENFPFSIFAEKDKNLIVNDLKKIADILIKYEQQT